MLTFDKILIPLLWNGGAIKESLYTCPRRFY